MLDARTSPYCIVPRRTVRQVKLDERSQGQLFAVLHDHAEAVRQLQVGWGAAHSGKVTETCKDGELSGTATSTETLCQEG